MLPISSARMRFAAVVAVAALLFTASAAATALRFTSMAAMSGTPMPGGWTLSAAWLPLCGRTWLQTGASFISMWASMMPAMMLPALAPMLWRERSTLTLHSGWLIVLSALGYLSVWLVGGVLLFPIGAAMAALVVHVPLIARAAPFAAGGVVITAGVFQCMPWKADRLQACHSIRACPPMSPTNALAALRAGMRFAVRCASCCGNWMAVLIATGVMDREATLIVSAAIAIERVVASRARLVRLIGMASIGAGIVLVARAI